MQFTKMHGIGNDFVMIDATGPQGPLLIQEARERAVALCDRKFGVGADGVILILPSSKAQFEMRMFNPDGSESEMCGNGIRCFAKFVYDRGLSRDTTLAIKTGAGILITQAQVDNEHVSAVTVDMGEAILERAQIPVDFRNGASGPIIAHPLSVSGHDYVITCVSMGNPHCIVFVEDVEAVDLAYIGPQFMTHPAFPRRINTEFVQIINRSEVKMRVWERGAGETLACGTGACASAVACALNEKTGRDVLVHLAGGDLKIEWRADNHVKMTGSATTVFEGEA